MTEYTRKDLEAAIVRSHSYKDEAVLKAFVESHDRLTSALEFYRDSWFSRINREEGIFTTPNSDLLDDAGQQATQALAQAQKWRKV